MSRGSDAGNAVGKAVADICGLYGVPLFRMQSRTFNVIGKGGRTRPMFTGDWTDAWGVLHHKGMADYLAMPRIPVSLRCDCCSPEGPHVVTCASRRQRFTLAVPLWIECKAGAGTMKPDQVAFKEYIEAMGGFHIVAQDSGDALLEWFKAKGVTRA